MKKLIPYLLLIFMVWSCSQPVKEHNQKITAPINDTMLMKACCIYSSEFAILDPNDAGRLIQEYRFNKRGFVNELIRYGMDGSIIAQFDIYGEENPFPSPGNLVYVDTVLTLINLDTQGEISKKEVNKYNDKGLLNESTLYSINDEMIQKNTYEYNAENRIIKDIYWDVELNEPMQVVRYEYTFFTKK